MCSDTLPLTDFNTAHNALIQASEKGLGVNVNEVNIIAPCFMAEADTAGAVQQGDLVFGLTTWASGHYATGPADATEISSFQVLDEIVEYYTDKTQFPSLNVCDFFVNRMNDGLPSSGVARNDADLFG
jgi:hypothetical protein